MAKTTEQKPQTKTIQKPKKSNELAAEEYNKQWEQEKNFKFVKRVNDPRFGEVTIVKNPSTNQVLMVKEKMVTSKAAATSDIKELKSRMALNHPNMMRMVNYTTSIKKGLCSTNYLSRAFYEFPRTDMSREVLDKKKDLAEFDDRQLTHMTYQSLYGLGNLHSREMAHGDIRPNLIGYDRNANQYQLLDRFADPTPIERCQTNNIVRNKDLYLSPQLYGKLKGKDKKATFNKQKNDMYALGMSVLNTGTQDSVKDCYYPNGTMNQKKLDSHLEEFDQKYKQNNPVLCHTVRRLLDQDENTRPGVNQMLQEIPTYDTFKQAEAENRPFTFDNKPVSKPVVVNNAPAFEFVKPKTEVKAAVAPLKVEKPVLKETPLSQSHIGRQYIHDPTRFDNNTVVPGKTYILESGVPIERRSLYYPSRTSNVRISQSGIKTRPTEVSRQSLYQSDSKPRVVRKVTYQAPTTYKPIESQSERVIRTNTVIRPSQYLKTNNGDYLLEERKSVTFHNANLSTREIQAPVVNTITRTSQYNNQSPVIIRKPSEKMTQSVFVRKPSEKVTESVIVRKPSEKMTESVVVRKQSQPLTQSTVLRSGIKRRYIMNERGEYVERIEN